MDTTHTKYLQTHLHSANQSLDTAAVCGTFLQSKPR